jgi:Ca2+-binding EF-hand superfamily protein
MFFMAVGLTREESKRSFEIDIIDADKNGEISFEEFMKAAEDFY